MKIFNEEMGHAGKGNTFVLILDRREAKQLIEIAEAAATANKRKSSFRQWAKKLTELLYCY
jgi:hypothetical protein